MTTKTHPVDTASGTVGMLLIVIAVCLVIGSLFYTGLGLIWDFFSLRTLIGLWITAIGIIIVGLLFCAYAKVAND